MPDCCRWPPGCRATSRHAPRLGVEHQLVTTDPADARRLVFRHALTRDTLLSQLLPFELIDLSRQAFDAIERHHPDFPGALCELAASLAETIDEQQRVAAELWLLAARRAYDTGAMSSAAPMLERGLGKYRPRARRLARDRPCARPGVENEWPGRPSPGGRDSSAASSATPFDEMHAQLELARAATSAARWDEAAAHVGWALRLAPTAQDAPTALIDLAAAEIAVGRGRFGDARNSAESAAVQAALDGDHRVVGEAWLVIGRCARMDDASDPAASFDRVIAIGREHGFISLALRGEMERASLDCWNLRPTDRLLAAVNVPAPSARSSMPLISTTFSHGLPGIGGCRTMWMSPPTGALSSPASSTSTCSVAWLSGPVPRPPASAASENEWRRRSPKHSR